MLVISSVWHPLGLHFATSDQGWPGLLKATGNSLFDCRFRLQILGLSILLSGCASQCPVCSSNLLRASHGNSRIPRSLSRSLEISLGHGLPWLTPRSVRLQVIFLDSDNVAVADVGQLFKTPEYARYGALLWADYWDSSAAPDLLNILGLQQSPLGTTESGQMVFDKARYSTPVIDVSFTNP